MGNNVGSNASFIGIQLFIQGTQYCEQNKQNLKNLVKWYVMTMLTKISFNNHLDLIDH